MASRRELARAMKRIIPIMGLSGWRLTIRFDPKMPNAADCTANPEYREAVIRFNPRKVKREEVVATCCHEAWHCLVWPLASLADLWAGQDPKRKEVVRQAEEMLTAQLDIILAPLIHQRVTGRPSPPLVRVEG